MACPVANVRLKAAPGGRVGGAVAAQGAAPDLGDDGDPGGPAAGRGLRPDHAHSELTTELWCGGVEPQHWNIFIFPRDLTPNNNQANLIPYCVLLKQTSLSFWKLLTMFQELKKKTQKISLAKKIAEIYLYQRHLAQNGLKPQLNNSICRHVDKSIYLTKTALDIKLF